MSLEGLATTTKVVQSMQASVKCLNLGPGGLDPFISKSERSSPARKGGRYYKAGNGRIYIFYDAEEDEDKKSDG